MGQFSYPVDQFTWEHMPMPKGGDINRALLDKKVDLIFHEDAPGCTYSGSGAPLIYYDIDSTLTDDRHYQPRLEQAKFADLVLVDQDRLERIAPCKRPVKRFSYCVNDRLFYDRGLSRDLDVVFHCPAGKWAPGGDVRKQIRNLLHDYCQSHHLTYASGAVDLQTYANHFARAKVVVNWSRTPRNRPHRVLDATASGACLVSSPIPTMTEAPIASQIVVRNDWNAMIYETPEELPAKLDEAFEPGFNMPYWELIARQGHEDTMAMHTWAIRAQELRLLVRDMFGI